MNFHLTQPGGIQLFCSRQKTYHRLLKSTTAPYNLPLRLPHACLLHVIVAHMSAAKICHLVVSEINDEG